MDFVTCNLVGPGNFFNYHNYGLGNQLFQISTALSYSIENNLTPIFPNLKHPKFGNYNINIFKNLNFSEYKDEDVKFEYFEPSFRYTKIPKAKNIRLNGYYQSEKYFKNNREYILEMFYPSKTQISDLKQEFKSIFDNAAVCHIRLGDYLVLEDYHNNLSKSKYYNKAFQMIESNKIIVFSDEIDVAQKIKFDTEKDLQFFTTGIDYLDMFCMTQFEEVIISNSTFSWWAAWLNNNTNKKILFPNQWFGPSKKFDTNDLIPNTWKKIKVE